MEDHQNRLAFEQTSLLCHVRTRKEGQDLGSHWNLKTTMFWSQAWLSFLKLAFPHLFYQGTKGKKQCTKVWQNEILLQCRICAFVTLKIIKNPNLHCKLQNFHHSFSIFTKFSVLFIYNICIQVYSENRTWKRWLWRQTTWI